MFNSSSVNKLIQLALDEDFAADDITSRLTLPEGRPAAAMVIAREPLVFCGGPLVERIFLEAGCRASIRLCALEGQELAENADLVEIDGMARDLLALERTTLNFLQRLCGIATLTRAWTRAAPGLIVLDTRKTTPGWRLLEKYAVKTGGGCNHRMGLSDMILVKNNHVDLLGQDLKMTLQKALAAKPRYTPVEVEVRTLQELAEVLDLEIDAVMLDNMSDKEIGAALDVIKARAPRLKVEVSGGLTVERLKTLQELGVNCVSCGALTNRARSVDISMKLESR